MEVFLRGIKIKPSSFTKISLLCLLLFIWLFFVWQELTRTEGRQHLGHVENIKVHNLNVPAALPSFTSWQPSTERLDEVITQMYLHDSIVPSTFFTHSHTRAHTLPNEETCPYSEDGTSHCYRVFILLHRETEKNTVCTVYQPCSPSWSPNRDVLAIKKWYMRTHNPPQFLWRESGYTQEDKMIQWLLGWEGSLLHGCQHEHRRGSDDDHDNLSAEGQTGIHACFSDLPPSLMRRGVELIKMHRGYTHKYCLFLACLRAARVWSLLKSPESDSKCLP